MHEALHVTVPNQVKLISITGWAKHKRHSGLENYLNLIPFLNMIWSEAKIRSLDFEKTTAISGLTKRDSKFVPLTYCLEKFRASIWK